MCATLVIGVPDVKDMTIECGQLLKRVEALAQKCSKCGSTGANLAAEGRPSTMA